MDAEGLVLESGRPEMFLRVWGLSAVTLEIEISPGLGPES